MSTLQHRRAYGHKRSMNKGQRRGRVTVCLTTRLIEMIEERSMQAGVTQSRFIGDLLAVSMLRMGLIDVALYEHETTTGINEPLQMELMEA